MDRFQLAQHKARLMRDLLDRRRRYKFQDEELGYRRSRRGREEEEYEYGLSRRSVKEKLTETQLAREETGLAQGKKKFEMGLTDREREIARQKVLDTREAAKSGYQQDQYLANVGLANARRREIERRMAGEGPPTTAEYNAYYRLHRNLEDTAGGLRPGAPSFDEWLLRTRHPRETVQRKKDLVGSLYRTILPSKGKGKKRKPVPGLYE